MAHQSADATIRSFKDYYEYQIAVDIKNKVNSMNDDEKRSNSNMPLLISMKTASQKELILSAHGKKWQNIIREIRVIIKNILSDSLITMIAEYCIADDISDIIWTESIGSGGLTCLNHCYYCGECDYNSWISIHTYIAAQPAYKYDIYRSQLICPNCLLLDYSKRKNKAHIIGPNGEEPIWVDHKTGLPNITDWTKSLQLSYDNNNFPHPKNDIAKLRFHCIDGTCKLFPINQFGITHQNGTILLQVYNIVELLKS